MKRKYESPKMYAETFVPNQYCSTCKEPIYDVQPMQVKCTSKGHNNTAISIMFLDSQDACDVKFNPGVGQAKDDKFYTQFEACARVVGCNKQNWLAAHPNDTNFTQHKIEHSYWFSSGNFIMHDTVIDLSTAEKYQLS